MEHVILHYLLDWMKLSLSLCVRSTPTKIQSKMAEDFPVLLISLYIW